MGYIMHTSVVDRQAIYSRGPGSANRPSCLNGFQSSAHNSAVDCHITLYNKVTTHRTLSIGVCLIIGGHLAVY